MRLILASGSPRRAGLLAEAGFDFELIPSTAEEIHDAGLGMGGLCEKNAGLKAEAVACGDRDAVVIGADTLVFVDGVALGKPRDLVEAAGMLRKLAGRWHEVCTGVCVAGPGLTARYFHEVTEVCFRELDEDGIAGYLEVTSPLDKAGGYGIQDRGGMIISEIRGEYENVMGLPVERLRGVLLEIGLPMGGSWAKNVPCRCPGGIR